MTTAIKQKNIYENSIKNWPKDERPREKLFKSGEPKPSVGNCQYDQL